MLKLFYRRFYILLFLIWLGATAGLFVLSVWGNFDTFVVDFSKVMRFDAEENETKDAAKDVASNAMDKATHKARVARDFVRQSISKEVLVIEKAVIDPLGVGDANREKRAMDKAVEQKAEKLLEKALKVQAQKKAEQSHKPARQHKGSGKLTEITFDENEEKLIVHLKTSTPVGKVTRFWLSNPTRAIVDLRGKWRNATSRMYTFKSGFMYQVVVGMHPDRLRIVFRFDDTKAPIGALPEFQHTDQGLDIIVKNPAHQ